MHAMPCIERILRFHVGNPPPPALNLPSGAAGIPCVARHGEVPVAHFTKEPNRLAKLLILQKIGRAHV